MEADDPRHGTPNGYDNLGCRCPACREAHRIDHYNWEHADPVRLQRKAEGMRKLRARRAVGRMGLSGNVRVYLPIELTDAKLDSEEAEQSLPITPSED